MSCIFRENNLFGNIFPYNAIFGAYSAITMVNIFVEIYIQIIVNNQRGWAFCPVIAGDWIRNCRWKILCNYINS